MLPQLLEATVQLTIRFSYCYMVVEARAPCGDGITLRTGLETSQVSNLCSLLPLDQAEPGISPTKMGVASKMIALTI